MTPKRNHRVCFVMDFHEALEIQDLVVTMLRTEPSERKDRLEKALERLDAAILRTEAKKFPPSKRLVARARKALLNPTTPKQWKEWDEATSRLLAEIRKEENDREIREGN